MTNYITKRDLKLWKFYDNKTKDQLISEAIAELSIDVDSVETDCLIEALKNSIGRKYTIPNAQSKKDMFEFGYYEKDLIKVNHILPYPLWMNKQYRGHDWIWYSLL